jgi:hypothetical protein
VESFTDSAEEKVADASDKVEEAAD